MKQFPDIKKGVFTVNFVEIILHSKLTLAMI